LHPEPTADFAGETRQKWIVTRDASGRLKHRLIACGITRASLFPDIDGLSSHLAWLYKWGKL
jgi:hypothetical protein